MRTPSSIYTYKPLRLLVWVYIGLSVIEILLGGGAALAYDFQARQADPQWAEGLGGLVALVVLARLAMSIGRVVVFATVLYRANANIRALGEHGAPTTPWGMIGWFFVPIASLWKPFQGVRDLFVYSSADEGERIGQRAPAIVSIWWAVFIVTQIIANTAVLRGSDDVAVSVGDVVVDLVEAATTIALFIALRDRIEAFAARASGVGVDDAVAVFA